MERCGKINASNSGSDSWTGIGVVAGFCTVVLLMQWPHRRNGEVPWRSELLQRLQEVRGNCKTRNQLFLTPPPSAIVPDAPGTRGVPDVARPAAAGRVRRSCGAYLRTSPQLPCPVTRR